MSWQALLRIKKIGTEEGPALFKDVFERGAEEGNKEQGVGRRKRGPGYAGKKAVLLVLAEAHWPTKPLRIDYETIARTASCSIATVRRACEWLDRMGIVIHEPHYDKRGRRACNEFHINFDGVPRDAFAAQVLRPPGNKKRRATTSQNDLKAKGSLEVNLVVPTSQFGGEQYLSTVSSTERVGGKLSLKDHHQEVTLPPGWELPEEDRRWTLAKVAGATDELITASAAVFWERGHDKLQTPQERSRAWRIWARKEREFKANARQVPRPPPPAQGIRRETLVRALTMYLRGMKFDRDLCDPPADRTEAIAWLASLKRTEEEFVTEFRSSPPPSQPTSTTEPRAAASCA